MEQNLISTELRDDCGAVFLNEYPAEGDVIGWLKVHRMADPLGLFSGQWADDVVQLIEELQQVLDAARDEPHRTARLENAIRAFDVWHLRKSKAGGHLACPGTDLIGTGGKHGCR